MSRVLLVYRLRTSEEQAVQCNQQYADQGLDSPARLLWSIIGCTMRRRALMNLPREREHMLERGAHKQRCWGSPHLGWASYMYRIWMDTQPLPLPTLKWYILGQNNKKKRLVVHMCTLMFKPDFIQYL